MAKSLKKATSLVLAVLMLLSVGVAAFSKDVSAYSWGYGSSYSITEDPADATVTEGDEAVFTVKANGQIKSVQWQVFNFFWWENLSTKKYGSSDTLKFVADLEDDGAKIRAYVTFKNGTKKASDYAKLTVLKKVEYPAAKLEASAGDVVIDAPEGALPKGTSLSVTPVTAEEVTALLGDTDYAGAEVLKSADISFANAEGVEIEPNSAVKVSFGVEGITSLEDIMVLHISDEGEVSEVALDPESTLDTLVFRAAEFSTFTVTWGNNNGNRVTIHHGYMENGSFVEFPAGSSTNTNYPTSLRLSDYNDYAHAVLIYDFENYTYNATYYRTTTSATPASGGTAIWPALQRRNTTWR